MKQSEIYAKAAQRIDEHNECHACVAIQAVSAGFFARAAALNHFSMYFEPRGKPTLWFGRCEHSADISPDEAAENRNTRVLALCFMAAIAEYEERHGAEGDE